MYTRTYGAKNYPLLRCNSCGEAPPIKSNAGIVEELTRISAYLDYVKPEKSVSCPNTNCKNFGIPVTNKEAYRSFGEAKSGSKRYQCKLCLKTVSIPKSTCWQHDTSNNIQIFKDLVAKAPFNRIVHKHEISWSVFYNRIDFIHRQCMAFAADREKELKTMRIRRLYLAIDKQDYEVNWTDRKDKRNVVLSAITSADNSTGYIFGIHPNFDYTLDKEAIEQDAIAINDVENAAPFRKYARLWLECDYRVASENSAINRYTSTLQDTIALKYDQAIARDDVEAFDEKSRFEKLPNYGMQVKLEYTTIAHFYFLKKLLGNVGKWRFFMDQESGIRAACLSAFKEEIAQRIAEAFYVSIEKDLTIDQKRRYVAMSNKAFNIAKANHPNATNAEIKLMLLMREIQSVTQLGHWKDKWVSHPLPMMAEANKSMCWLTEHNDFTLEHQAWLYNKASLHSVDSFFGQVRRLTSIFERPIHSSGNRGRTWSGYAPYNPAIAVKVLEIFRVYHNFIDAKKRNGVKTTPASRLGLAKAPLGYKDILYF